MSQQAAIIGVVVAMMMSSSAGAAFMLMGGEEDKNPGPGPAGPAPPSKEVFYLGHAVSPGHPYGFLKGEATAGCQSVGAVVASTAQLTAAQGNGADWCATGWLADSDTAMYPITTRLEQGCGSGSAGVKGYTPQDNKAGINCYGVKPSRSEADPRIHAFSTTKWSRYD